MHPLFHMEPQLKQLMLSRQDAYFGQWSRFNATVWNWTMAYWTSDVLDIQIIANGRAQRATRSNLTNPEYALSDLGYAFSLGENAAILSILGDKVTQTCPKAFANFLFSKKILFRALMGDAGILIFGARNSKGRAPLFHWLEKVRASHQSG